MVARGKDSKPWSKAIREKSAEVIVCLDTSLPKDSRDRRAHKGRRTEPCIA